jgi:pimeloyl-ACP methyl ester carboxylesterase
MGTGNSQPPRHPRPSPAGFTRRLTILTSTRVVALALIAFLVIGLLYLRFAPGAGPVAVPKGASAGDLILEPCEYATESGSYPADCGTLVVPETRADPEPRLIALPVTRIRARSDDPKEPVFFLTGGPGQSNMEFEFASRYAEDRDFVLVGYRGVDGSVRLDCPEVESALKRSTDVLSDEFFRAYGDGYRSCADRLTDDGVDLASYGLVQQVDDLETARVALGYDQINLLSESAGTRTAMIYAWRYPESVHRSVMVAVNPPGAFLFDADTTDEQIGRYAALCANDDSCRTRTDDLAATLRGTAADIPDRWLFLPIKDANVRVVSMLGLLDSTAAASPTPAPMTLDAWLSAAEGDASGFWSTSVLGDLLFPELFVRGQYAAAPMLDAQASRDYFARGQGDLSNLGRAATAFTWGGGVLADSWPAAPEEGTYSRVPTSEVETLLIGGELDPMTPPQVATTQLLPYLPNGHQVVLPGFGHQLTVFNEQPEAGSRLINTFFDSGQVDDSLYVPASVDFTPSMTFGALAKTALGVMLALAALTVLSLLVMARRVRTRGRIGPKSGAVLRSVYPLVLGLGGWCLGALIVLTTMPGVRIDDALLVILSVGVPIGVGIYWAWVHRDWSARSKRVGLGAAATGALAGAWLGFYAIDGLLAILTAIVAAVAGANLALLVLDMSRARSARNQSAATTAAVAPSPDPAPAAPTAVRRS